MEFKIYSNMYVVTDTLQKPYKYDNLILINEALELTNWLSLNDAMNELAQLIGLYLHDDSIQILTNKDIIIPNIEQYLTILLNKTEDQTLIIGFFIEMRKILRNNNPLFTVFNNKQYNITKYSLHDEDKI